MSYIKEIDCPQYWQYLVNLTSLRSIFGLGCKIPPPKNPSSGKSLLQNPSTAKSLPAKSLLRKIPLSKIFLGKIPTSKIPLEIKSLLMNFIYNLLSCFLFCFWLLNYFIVQWITFHFEKCFSNFSCIFLNPNILFQFEF